jgi:hypothetical protein
MRCKFVSGYLLIMDLQSVFHADLDKNRYSDKIHNKVYLNSPIMEALCLGELF